MPEAGCQAMEGPLKCLASTQTLSHPDFARSASRATIAGDWWMLRSGLAAAISWHRPETTHNVRDCVVTVRRFEIESPQKLSRPVGKEIGSFAVIHSRCGTGAGSCPCYCDLPLTAHVRSPVDRLNSVALRLRSPHFRISLDAPSGACRH